MWLLYLYSEVLRNYSSLILLISLICIPPFSLNKRQRTTGEKSQSRNKIWSSMIIKDRENLKWKKYNHQTPKQLTRKGWPGRKGKFAALTGKLKGRGKFLVLMGWNFIVKVPAQRWPCFTLLSIWPPPEVVLCSRASSADNRGWLSSYEKRQFLRYPSPELYRVLKGKPDPEFEPRHRTDNQSNKWAESNLSKLPSLHSVPTVISRWSTRTALCIVQCIVVVECWATPMWSQLTTGLLWPAALACSQQRPHWLPLQAIHGECRMTPELWTCSYRVQPCSEQASIPIPTSWMSEPRGTLFYLDLIPY